MSDSNEWIREVNGKVDHGIMTFDFFKTNEAKINFCLGSCTKLKRQGSHFLQTLKSKKQGFYLFKQTLKAKKQGFYSFFFIANFRKLKKQGFYFLQTLKANKQGFYFFFVFQL